MILVGMWLMTNIWKQSQCWDCVTQEIGPVSETRGLIESLIPLTMIRGHNVLDAGCGAGDYSAAMLKMGARQVTSFDVSVGSLKRAHKLTAKVAIEQASLCNLPYRSY